MILRYRPSPAAAAITSGTKIKKPLDKRGFHMHY